MYERMPKKSGDKFRFQLGWFFEFAAIATVTPALVYGVLSLNNLPIA